MLTLLSKKLTEWFSDFGFSGQATFVDFNWTGVPLKTDDIQGVPLFWGPSQCAFSLGLDLTSYLADTENYVVLPSPYYAKKSTLIKRPRFLTFPFGGGMSGLSPWTKEAIEELSTELSEAGVFCGKAISTSGGYAFCGLPASSYDIASDPNPGDVDIESPYAIFNPDEAEGGECLFIDIEVLNGTLSSYVFGSADGNEPTAKQNLIDKNVDFIKNCGLACDKAKWLMILLGRPESSSTDFYEFYVDTALDMQTAVGGALEISVIETADDIELSREVVKNKIKDTITTFFNL